MVSKHRDIEESHRQKKLRKARDEHAFIFTSDLSKCLAKVEREDWEYAIASTGGNPADASEMLGIRGVPRNTKVLWGRSEEEAKGTYRNWQKRRAKMGKRKPT
jgi:DNA-binding NtrC family response regulator